MRTHEELVAMGPEWLANECEMLYDTRTRDGKELTNVCEARNHLEGRALALGRMATHANMKPRGPVETQALAWFHTQPGNIEDDKYLQRKLDGPTHPHTKHTAWGVFVRHDGATYAPVDAIRVYRTQRGAEAHAETLTMDLLGTHPHAAPHGFVARPLP